ncbi:MAG: lysophospholipid acyltransferase family protein [Isosphaeraceae bacterium]|nr:lysophospholipid acyltransferase family protein [Isosphaeraceae bacterium]
MTPRAPAPNFIEAHKSGWPRLAVDRMIRGRMRSGLSSVRAQGIIELRSALESDATGVVFVANHSCWWDLFLAHFLNESIPVDGYGMMMHENLRRFGFFRRIGAFSIDRSSPSGIKASLDYTARLLARPRTGVWIFPQGKIESNDARPLEFEKGLRTLVRRMGRARLVPTALRYDFWQEERPEACVRFGTPTFVEPSDRLLDDWRDRVTAELDQLRLEMLSQDPTRFVSLMRGRASISESRGRLLDRLRRSPGRERPTTEDR